MKTGTPQEIDAAQQLEKLLMDLTLLDPADPAFPGEVRRLGHAFIALGDAMEQVGPPSRPS
jgi:hypothetical protein